MSQFFEVNIEKPGRLAYREENYEYTFPFYEQNDEVVVVDITTRRRAYFASFGWIRVPNEYPSTDKKEVQSRLLAYFFKIGRRVRLFEKNSKNKQPFPFHPELLEHRGTAIALLEDAGFMGLTDYSSIDILHGEYGLEVCGIRQQSNVISIVEVMQNGFSWWHYHEILFKDNGAEAGWKVFIHMFPRCGNGAC